MDKKDPIQEWSEEILLVSLPPEPEMQMVLKNLRCRITEEDWNVVIDFSLVDVIFDTSISQLLVINRNIKGSGLRLIFSNVARGTKDTFTVMGLEELFKFADNNSIALGSIESDFEV